MNSGCPACSAFPLVILTCLYAVCDLCSYRDSFRARADSTEEFQTQTDQHDHRRTVHEHKNVQLEFAVACSQLQRDDALTVGRRIKQQQCDPCSFASTSILLFFPEGREVDTQVLLHSLLFSHLLQSCSMFKANHLFA